MAAGAKRIMVFGDSNSWGWMPVEEGTPSGRYPQARQWPEVMRAVLGEGHEVIVEALNGRTTDVHDPSVPQIGGAGLNGAAYLPAALASHVPLDLVIVMLGTNDTKEQYARSPLRIALGAGLLVETVLSSGSNFGTGWHDYPAPRVLLIAPPPLGQGGIATEQFQGGQEKSRQLAPLYRKIAEAAGVAFLDAGEVIATDGVDGVHFSAAAQRALGLAVAEAVRRILA